MNSFDSIFKQNLFEDQTILVTGGGSGIGRCIAHELAALGAKVIISGRNLNKLKIVEAEIRDSGGLSFSKVLNIRNEEEVDSVISEIVSEHSFISGLVNNAGGQFASPASMIRTKGWRAVIDTNLNGTWWVTQSVFNQSMASTGGCIVNIVADMWNGFPTMAHTGAARAGIVNLTQTLAIEWGCLGVRVNAVAPGFILSSGLNNYPEDIQEVASELMSKNPSSRAGTESEVSSAVVFLLSKAASFITGSVIKVDGGASLQKAPLFPIQEHNNIKPWNGFHLEASIPSKFIK